jgi:hypothetical protein
LSSFHQSAGIVVEPGYHPGLLRQWPPSARRGDRRRAVRNHIPPALRGPGVGDQSLDRRVIPAVDRVHLGLHGMEVAPDVEAGGRSALTE